MITNNHIICLFGFIVILFNSCTKEKKANYLNQYAPKTIEVESHVVPWSDSIQPEIIALNIQKVTAGKPKTIQLKSKSYPVSEIPVVQLGTPVVNVIGQGKYKLPAIVPATDSSVVAGSPEIVEAKEPLLIEDDLVNVSKITTSQGLKNNSIHSLLQDNKGNLWIGTNKGGLSKYDGKFFTHYSLAQGLSSNDIQCLMEDKKGNLWIGTFNGLNKFDGKTLYIFTTHQGLISNSVWGLLEDREGNIWIKSTGGLSKFDGKNFTNYTEDQGLNLMGYDTFFEDNDGNLWFDYENSFCKFDNRSFSYFPKSGVLWADMLTTFKKNKFDGKSVIKYSALINTVSDNFVGILPGMNDNVWFYTKKGLYKYENNSIEYLGFESGLTGANPELLFGDRSGNLWIGSDAGGVAKVNRRLFTHLRITDSLNRQSITNIIINNGDKIFACTEGGGLFSFDGNYIYNYTTSCGLTSNYLVTGYNDRNGNIWLTTWDKGLIKFDGKTFTNFQAKERLNLSHIKCMFEDRLGNLWFGTRTGGILKFNEKNFTYYNSIKGLSSSEINCIIEDGPGNMWFGTSDAGVFKFDGKSFVQYQIKNGLNNASVLCMLADKQGNFWFGTETGGAYRFDGKSFLQYTTEQGLVNNTVNSIYEDDEGNIWFGTINGLSRMIQRTNGKMHNDIVGDKEFLPSFKNYLVSDGFTGIGTVANGLIQDKNGIIWAGTSDRITAYHREEDRTDTIPPDIRINGISLFNENVNWLEIENNKTFSVSLHNGIKIKNLKYTGLSNLYCIPENLELTHNINSITFKFIGITTNRPKDVRYKYRLDGLEDNWSLITEKTEATYNNLAPGQYTFLVKAMNVDGFWSNEQKYQFIIKPPWWQTWWAYIIYGLLIIPVTFVVNRYIRNRVIRQEREKAQIKELEQAKEIEKAYHELEKAHLTLKSTQSQLIQSEKMASLGELTAGIAHEIQNPLNFVNNFSEINKELIDELKEELAEGSRQLAAGSWQSVEDKLKSAEEIANDVIVNEQKINHHGKRADAIVKGMLQHSRTSTGQKEPTDINALADEYLRLSYHGMRAKDKSFNVEYKTEFDPNLSKINVVPQDIGRVLLNLINNAFYAVSERNKKGEPGFAPAVTVTTKLAANSQLQVAIKDNGPGIPSSILDKIFQPFFTTKPTGQGTGLGLSLAYDIVKAHGGEIKVETKEGKGSQFIIHLPIS